MVFHHLGVARPFAIAPVITGDQRVVGDVGPGFGIFNIAFRPARVITDVNPDDVVGIIHGGHGTRQGPRTWNIGYV